MSNEELKDKIVKLPSWARRHIAMLERERDCARKDAATFSCEQVTRVLVPDYVTDKPRICLPETSPVRFVMNSDAHKFIDVNRTDKMTCVSGLSGVVVRGHYTIRIYPVASNVVEIALEDR